MLTESILKSDTVMHLPEDLMSTDTEPATSKHHEPESNSVFPQNSYTLKNKPTLFPSGKGVHLEDSTPCEPSRSNNTKCFTFTFTKLMLFYPKHLLACFHAKETDYKGKGGKKKILTEKTHLGCFIGSDN